MSVPVAFGPEPGLRPAEGEPRTGRMARRALLGQLVALLAGSSTCLAQAQRARVGWLGPGPLPKSGVRSLNETLLLDALRQKGWNEPTNLVLEARGPASDKTLAVAAAELLSLKPDVLVSSGTPAIRALRDLTTEIPIVMVGAGDPVGTGLVASLARPGGNVTGASWRLDDLIPKTLSLLHEMVPHAKRVDMVNQAVNQAGDPGHALFAKGMLDAARSRSLECQVFQVRSEDELVTTIAGSPADGLLMLATPMIYANPERMPRPPWDGACRLPSRVDPPTTRPPGASCAPIAPARRSCSGTLPTASTASCVVPGRPTSPWSKPCATTSSSTSRPRAPWD